MLANRKLMSQNACAHCKYADFMDSIQSANMIFTCFIELKVLQTIATPTKLICIF